MTQKLSGPQIADALESLLWPNMAIGNKAIIKVAIDALRAEPEQEPYWWAIENRHGDARFVEDEHTENNIWDEVHELNEKDENGKYFDNDAPYKVVPVYRGPVVAHEQEPVAWRIHTPLTNVTYVELNSESVERVRIGCAKENIEVEITPLSPLHTHPAPSIPAAVPDSLFEGWFEAVEAGDDKDWKKPEYLSKEWHAYLARHQLALGAFQFCRAAMLQSEPQNAPQNIPENIPAGYVLVPVEPTQDMIWAAKNVLSSTTGWDSFKRAYQSMIATASKSEPVKQKVTLREGIQVLRGLGGIDAEKILAARDALNDSVGWIPVSERLPERGVDVLACKMNLFGAYDEIETAQWHGGMRIEQPVFITSADTIEPHMWQPLPAPPKP